MVQPEDRTFRVLQSDLVNEMRETIRARGPQPFSWFMREALYHPLHGYYSSGRAIIGRRGDYFTNVSVGPMFGRLLAAQFAEMWRRLGQPHDFTIVEQGAHDGQFARDVLDALRTDAPELFETVRYRIVEPFPALQDRQRNGLHDFASKVEWCDVLAPFTGVHFSNELLDAIPVDLWSRLVGLDQDRFIFAEGPVNSRPNESQLAWVDDAAANLQQGFVLAIDYGFARPDFREVVQARAQHRHLDSVFEMIGDADISVHINWTDMAERALNRGLHLAGFTDQHHFLTGILAHLDIIDCFKQSSF
jgi:SAM-dependent MidA family methyltransferase